MSDGCMQSWQSYVKPLDPNGIPNIRVDRDSTDHSGVKEVT